MRLQRFQVTSAPSTWKHRFITHTCQGSLEASHGYTKPLEVELVLAAAQLSTTSHRLYP